MEQDEQNNHKSNSNLRTKLLTYTSMFSLSRKPVWMKKNKNSPNEKWVKRNFEGSFHAVALQWMNEPKVWKHIYAGFERQSVATARHHWLEKERRKNEATLLKVTFTGTNLTWTLTLQLSLLHSCCILNFLESKKGKWNNLFVFAGAHGNSRHCNNYSHACSQPACICALVAQSFSLLLLKTINNHWNNYYLTLYIFSSNWNCLYFVKELFKLRKFIVCVFC